ncbi:hypothetical protein [Aureimonas pseudogalii]|uniref:Uncharacterized protein n=1 Tax=Aureimonas pseudogalii TaxID=1744844 RepID=A0A7W6EAX8_9HYPH|nr:hypothetical protein [Aureimonas pseudogalii]MBB3997973.1 hypothetical protein [Aureimonas pseudogalii]
MLGEIGIRMMAWVMARPDMGRLSRWHQASPCRPVMLRDGRTSSIGGGQIWRRRIEGGWEYEQDDCYAVGVDDLRGDDWN